MKFATFTLLLALWFQVAETITSENLQAITSLGEVRFEDSSIRDLAFSPDGNSIFLARRPDEGALFLNGEIIQVNIEDLTDIRQTIYSEILANVVAFSPDGTLFAVGQANGEIWVFDAQNLELITSFQGSLDIVNDLAISPNNAYIGATFANPVMVSNEVFAFRLFSLSTGEEIYSYPLDTDIYGAGVSFDERGDLVFFSLFNMVSESGQVFAYEISTQEETLLGEGNNEWKLIYHPDRNALYYAGRDEVYFTYPLSKTFPIADFIRISHEADHSIINFALHPSEALLAVSYLQITASGNDAGIVRFYDSETGEELEATIESDSFILHLEFSPDGTLLATGDFHGVVRLWGIPAGE